MDVWSVISQKGGSGKTTLALHLAVEAAHHRVKTLLLDLDPQASTVRWADRRGGKAVKHDIDVASEHAARLPQALRTAEAEGYGLVLVDTAPNADQSSLAAARASSIVLIPCRPSILDLDAIGMTLDLSLLANKPAMVVLNAAPIRSSIVGEAAKTITDRGSQVCSVIVRERVAFRHSLISGLTAREFDPSSKAAAEIAELYKTIRKTVRINPKTK